MFTNRFASSLSLLAVLIGTSVPAPVFAQSSPQLLSSQGTIRDSGGNPFTGSHTLAFSIYSTPTGGTPLWTETQTVQFSNGVYSTLLGQTTPLTCLFGSSSDERWLETAADGNPAFTPRQKLTASPYAQFSLKAADSSQLGGLPPAAYALASSVPTANEALHLLRGTVSSAGAAEAGSGFTVSRQSAGTYLITFATAFASPPSVTVTARQTPAIPVVAVTGSNCTVQMYSTAGPLADCAFCFIAAGPNGSANVDQDQDGVTVADGDCNDFDPNVSPDHAEVCSNGVDDDCDGQTDEIPVWYRDQDGDSYGTNAMTQTGCTQPAGYVSRGGDCNDTNAAYHPGAAEVCDVNGVDEDCDGLINGSDPGVVGTSTWYADADGDGYGSASSPYQGCTQPIGHVANSSDCDDGDPSVFPGATEACNGVDDDCDGTPDDGVVGSSTWYVDADGDGYGSFSSTVQACSQPVGYAANAADCDDGDAGVHPGAVEVCNGVDDDCDGNLDDADPQGATGASAWYIDTDGDGYGSASSTVQACSQPVGYVANAGDCDDSDANINPGAVEVCDGNDVDEDCDGLADDNDPGVVGGTTWYPDADGDGYGDGLASGLITCDTPLGHVSNNGDCDDTDAQVNPGQAEVPGNGVDDDCDGNAS